MARKKATDLSEKLSAQNPKYTLNLYGHKEIEENFIKEWNNRDKISIHPVWLLSGETGIGKSTLAYKIARFVFRTMHSGNGIFGDEKLTNMNEDENDSIYQKMKSGGLGDFFIISNTNEDGSSSPIKMDDISNLIDRMQLTSMEGEWRVCIIDKLDDMNRNCANSLLKILEEPPEKTLFILIADKLSGVLPTIRSRSHIEKLGPLSDINLRKVIYDKEPEIDLPEDLIFLSNGSAGKAMYFINNGNLDFFTELKNLIFNEESNVKNIMDFSKRVARKPEVFATITSILLDLVHRESVKNPTSEKSFMLAELYSEISANSKKTIKVYLNYETVLMQTILRIKKCL